MNCIRPKKGKSVDDLCRNVGCDLADHPMEDDEEELDLIEAKSNFGLPTEALIPKIPAEGLLSSEKREPPLPIPAINHNKTKDIFQELKDEMKTDSLLITSQ